MELLGQDLGFAGAAMLEDGNGGDVCEGLRGEHIGVVQGAFVGAEQVEGADGHVAQPHR